MKIPTLILALFSLLLQGGGQTIAIPIKNPSFEQVSAFRYTDSCGTGWWFAADWQMGAGSAVFQPANPNPCWIALPPSGAFVGMAGYGSSFHQTLSISPQDVQGISIPNYGPAWTEGFYVLTFSVANYYPKYPGYYTANVSFGMQELCEASGWGTQKFAPVTVVCPGPEYIVGAASLPDGGIVQGKQQFVITFTVNDGSANGGWPIMFDDVSLTFTPN